MNTETTNETTWNEVAAASAAAEQESAHPPRSFKQLLPVPLTEKEIAERAKRAAAFRAMVAEYEASKKSAADHWKAKIELAENERDGLLDAIAMGTEERPVECLESREYRLGVVRVVRVDTGEVISDRAMSFAERQGTLPGVEEDEDAVAADEDGEHEVSVSPSDKDDFFCDEDAPAIDDPQAVLDGEPQAVAAKKRTRRAKKGGAS